MLILSRKRNEAILIDGGIRITVVSVRGNQVRLGIEAPGEVGIYREELILGSNTSGTETGPIPTDRGASLTSAAERSILSPDSCAV